MGGVEVLSELLTVGTLVSLIILVVIPLDVDLCCVILKTFGFCSSLRTFVVFYLLNSIHVLEIIPIED